VPQGNNGDEEAQPFILGEGSRPAEVSGKKRKPQQKKSEEKIGNDFTASSERQRRKQEKGAPVMSAN